MRIAFVAHEIHKRGGMERAAAEVLERVPPSDDVTVIASACELNRKVTWIRARSVRRPALLRGWLLAREARRADRELRPDLLCSIGAAASEADVIVAQFCHAAFTARYGGMRGSGLLGRKYQAFAQRMFTAQERAAYQSPRLKRVIAVSHGTKRELMQYYGLDSAKIDVVPNGVDRAVFKPADDDAQRLRLRQELGIPPAMLVCLFVGGDWARKGVGDAIAAIAQVEGAVLIVVGSGDVDGYRSIAERHGVAERILFAGPSRTPEKYYAAADIFVFPSRYEAFSLVTLEAAASGLPLITLRINGTEELVVDGHNGFFVDGSSGMIATRMRELRDDRPRLRKMGEAARASTDAYTWDRVAGEQLKVFRRAAGEAPCPEREGEVHRARASPLNGGEV